MRFFAYLAFSLLVLPLVIPAAFASDGPIDLPRATNLQKQGQVAQKRHTPVVLVVVSNTCPYCQKLEEEILRPLILSGEYVDRIQLQILNQDDYDHRIDFDGSKRSPGAIADRYRIQLVPTVLILGPNGEELAERLIGINVVDYYWAYLDRAIEEASSKLQADNS